MKKILIGTVLVIGLAVAGNYAMARFGHYGFGMGSGWGMMAGYGNNGGSFGCSGNGNGNNSGIQERWPSQNRRQPQQNGRVQGTPL